MEPTGFFYFQLIMKEAEEIRKHKWIESEKVGYDIGIHRAHFSWAKNHRRLWMDSEIKRFKK